MEQRRAPYRGHVDRSPLERLGLGWKLERRRVPGAGDDVTIDTNFTVVHSDDVTDTINSLTMTGPLSITGGTLSITGGTAANPVSSTIGGTLSVSDLGTLSTDGAVA